MSICNKTSTSLEEKLLWVLCAITLLTFWKCVEFDFINYDDDVYTYSNRMVMGGISLESIKWAFTTSENGMWHPLTWLSFQLESGAWQLKPFGYHLTNLWIHVINVFLLFKLLSEFSQARVALLASCIFALHPSHVETVVWISERKGLLSTTFIFSALLWYTKWLHTNSRKEYCIVLFLCVVANLFKTIAVVIPFGFFIIDIFFNRMSPSSNSSQKSFFKCIVEKIPFLMISIAGIMVGNWSQGDAGSINSYSPAYIFCNVVYSYFFYLQQFLYPTNLAILYPRPAYWEGLEILVKFSCLLVLSVISWKTRKRFPLLFFGWLWYAIFLFPMSGVVPIGPQLVADRYSYLPLIGLVLVLAKGLSNLIRSSTCFYSVTTCISIICAILSFSYLQTWKNSVSVFENAINKGYSSKVIYNNLGVAYVRANDFQKAEKQFRLGIQTLRPYDVAICNLADCLYYLQKNKDAIALLERWVKERPKSILLKRQLAKNYTAEGRFQDAKRLYSAHLQSNPSDYSSKRKLAWILAASTDSTARDPKAAVLLSAELSAISSFKEPKTLELLGAAYGSAEVFDLAYKYTALAKKYYQYQNSSDQVNLLSARLTLFSNRVSFVETNLFY